eukprot:jgi/Botrbrau1/13870/Bobra.0056s0102.1
MGKNQTLSPLHCWKQHLTPRGFILTVLNNFLSNSMTTNSSSLVTGVVAPS